MQASASSHPAEAPPVGTDASGGHPCRLLLIDDEVGFVDVLAKRIARRSFEVHKAYSGTEALRIIRDLRFDAAILDLKMEDMDGIDVLRVIKRMAPHLPVIMLTGHGCQEAAREGMEAGAFDYLTKPCEFEELMKKIELAIQSFGGCRGRDARAVRG